MRRRVRELLLSLVRNLPHWPWSCRIPHSALWRREVIAWWRFMRALTFFVVSGTTSPSLIPNQQKSSWERKRERKRETRERDECVCVWEKKEREREKSLELQGAKSQIRKLGLCIWQLQMREILKTTRETTCPNLGSHLAGPRECSIGDNVVWFGTTLSQLVDVQCAGHAKSQDSLSYTRQLAHQP